MVLKDFQGVMRQVVTDNASTILTAGGVVGTVMTAVLAGRAAVKADELIKEREHAVQQVVPIKPVTKLDKAILVAPVYIPPVVVGSLTIASIVLANQISASRAAALAAAYGVSQTQFEEYKAKVAEKLTGTKRQAVDDELAQDRVTKRPPNQEVVIVAGGDVLCYDQFTGRYFRSTVEQIRRAEHLINVELANCQYAGLSQFYDHIGLAPTTMSDMLGWSMFDQDLAFEVKFSTVMTPDEKPCLAIDFNTAPRPDFARSY